MPVPGELFPASLIVSQPLMEVYFVFIYNLSADYSSVSDEQLVLYADQMVLFKTKNTPSVLQLLL